MRRDIVHIGAGELHYEVLGVAQTAGKLEKLGLAVQWENIGDPIAMGQVVPPWMKDIVSKALNNDSTYGYSPTQGLLRTREFLANECLRKNKCTISPEDIVFFNGLGDATNKIFGLLRRTARVLVPSPSYMTYTSAEAAHAGAAPVSYLLDPRNGWLPSINDIETRIRYNPSIAAILIVNPDNPTGLVYPEKTLREIVHLADKYDLFLIADEVYENITYNGKPSISLAQVIGDVPGIALKSMSKEVPWPGARCGWFEVYNKKKCPSFELYINSIINAKMSEVCSTTLPQKVLPEIISHSKYKPFLDKRVNRYEKLAKIAYETFCGEPQVLVNPCNGAFYFTVVFQDDHRKPNLTLPIANKDVREKVEDLAYLIPNFGDERFFLYLLGATGICTVPLSSFNTELHGFRMTLLENDPEQFQKKVIIIKDAIKQYMSSV